MNDRERYRPCVGFVLFNAQRQVWLGQRHGAPAPYNWQFPQGGIDRGETAEAALFREMYEEIGLTRDRIRILDRTDCELVYRYPAEVIARRPNGFLGQRQHWYALEVTDAPHFRFDLEDPPEFSNWKWTHFHEAVERVIPFKRAVYEAVAGRFLHLTTD